MTDGIVWSTLKPTWSYWGILNQVWLIMKTSQDNDMIDHIGEVYIKKETEFMCSIRPGAVCH